MEPMQARPAQHGRGSPASGTNRCATAARGRALRRLRAEECDIRLTLPARAENVAVVRHVVAALAEALMLPPKVVDDIRLAVTEASTNVVRHAYVGGAEGPLDVEVTPDAGCLTVVVSDRGRGIQPNPDSQGAGLGLSLIAALADDLEIEHAPDAGSRLCMSFAPRDGTLQPA